MTRAGSGELRFEVTDGPRRLEAWVQSVGRDVVVVVGGGDSPHVGCVVLAQARPSTADPRRTSVTSSVLTIPPHKEEPLARTIAERLARELGGVVVVSAGVHEDGLDMAGAAAYVGLAGRLAGLIAERALVLRRSAPAAEPGAV